MENFKEVSRISETSEKICQRSCENCREATRASYNFGSLGNIHEILRVYKKLPEDPRYLVNFREFRGTSETNKVAEVTETNKSSENLPEVPKNSVLRNFREFLGTSENF